MLSTFASKTFEANTFEAGTFTGIGATVVVPPVEPEVSSVFRIHVIRSSGRLLPDTKFPFTTIQKIATTVDSDDTCNARMEESFYDFITFSRQRKELNRIQDEIEERYEGITLDVTNRRFAGLFWIGRQLEEPTTGLYKGTISYQIFAERLFSSAHNTGTTSGKTALECIFKRYTESLRLRYRASFAASNFALEESKNPIIVCSNFITTEDSRDTCGRIEKTEFSLIVYDTQAENVEEIKEIIMDEYDYAKFIIENRNFLSFSYVGDRLLELEGNIWQGEIVYSLLAERTN